MDDSEDFTDLCSRLLKRVRKREADKGKFTEDKSQLPNRAKERAKRKRLRSDLNPGSVGLRGSLTTDRSQASCPLPSDEHGGLEKASEEAAVVARATPEVTVHELALKRRPLGVKEKVVSRMQQFKWVSPQKLKLNGCEEPVGCEGLHADILPPPQKQEPTAAPVPDPQGDEALALQLQQELDREAQMEPVDLEDGGLFFCQICQRDLSAMNPMCRAQHINRCLDESEDRVPPPRAHPRILECLICGKGFKSEKSRAAHLKRCSVDMGVAPTVLMEALQRQAVEEAARGSSTDQPPPPGRPKRKGPRRKPSAMDEDTMVAMTLSRSMLKQDLEKEILKEGQWGAAQAVLAHPLGCRAGRGKRCRKKGAPPAPPPLLLVQDPRDALLRLQDRISALLLCTQPDRPPTPRLPTSSLALWEGAAPLWQKSALQDGGPLSILDFYTPELKPWVLANVVKLNPEGPCQTVSGTPGKPLLRAGCSFSPVAKRLEPVPTPATSPPPVGNQTLCDLMDLAEEGMTLTQYGGVTTDACTYKEQSDPLPSGFDPAAKAAAQSTAPLSRLATDLASMVNNPQLSDVQLQVDSGDVFFTHSFMLYARCPLLAQSVHDSGFGVQEEGMPLAQRVLLGEVPAEAVLALLQYLYTGLCPLTPELVTQVQELAVRFELKELQELCQQHARERTLEPWGVELEQNDEGEEAHNEEQNFLELLRSMWEEEGDVPVKYRQEGSNSPLLGDVEPGDERVDEDELEEIYEFAATQRKLESGSNIGEEDEEEEDREDCHADTEEGEGSTEKGGSDCISGNRFSLVKAEAFVKKLISQGTDESKEDSLPSQDSMVSCQSIRDSPAGESPPEGQAYQMTVDMMEQPAVVTVPFAEAVVGPDETGLVGSSKPGSVHSPHTSLDRSYNCLFSQSWGNYTEPSPSQPPHHCPSASLAADLQCIERPDVDGVFKPVPNRASGHQGFIIDLSVSPSPDLLESSLPISGVSPGSTEGKNPEVLGSSSSSTGDPDISLSHKQAGTGHVDKCIPSSSVRVICSKRDTRPMTPDLVVISDSGDEMDFSTGNMEVKSPPMSNQQSQISVNVGEKVVNPEDHSCNAHAPARLSLSPPMNGSAEMSWLIPSTPVQPHKTTRTGSTQTYSSMCRTKLFPMSLGDGSRSLSSSFSSPRMPHTLTSLEGTEKLQHQAAVGLHIVDSANLLERPASSSSCTSNLKIGSACGLSKGEGSWSRSSNVVLLNSGLVGDSHKPDMEPKESPPASIIPLSQLELSRRTSSQHRCFVLGAIDCSGVPPNASSTPLHPKVPERLYAARHSLPQSNHILESNQKSPVCQVSGDRIPSAGERSSENQQRDDPGSPHLSVTLQSPQRDADVGCRLRESPDKHGFLTGPKHIESSDMARFSESNGNLAEEEEESSLARQRFCAAEEPPIPFDSWGQSAHFSLRLSPPSLTPPAIGQDPPKNISEPHASMLDSKLWDDWEGDKEGADEDLGLPFSQSVCPKAPAPSKTQLSTPVASRRKGHPPPEPITPMPAFSDMETPELKNRLNKFGVRPLPKRQMVLKLREIHQYTHQLLSSDSESESPVLNRKPHAGSSGVGPVPPKAAAFKEPAGVTLKTCPKAPPAGRSEEGQRDGDEQSLSASQGSTTSASEVSDRSNPEFCPQSDDDSDSDEVTPSQAVSRDAAKLQAVRNFLQSDSELYGQILQYQPLVLAHLQARLKAAGIRLGAVKLLDFLDSQCITVTTANCTKPRVSRRRGHGRGAKAKAAL